MWMFNECRSATPICFSSLVFSCAFLACASAVTSDSLTPECKFRDPYPRAEWPCLAAMKELGLPEGMEIMGVTARPRPCAISIDFERREALEAFVHSRAAAGLEPRKQQTTACDGILKEIELLLSVGGKRTGSASP